MIPGFGPAHGGPWRSGTGEDRGLGLAGSGAVLVLAALVSGLGGGPYGSVHDEAEPALSRCGEAMTLIYFDHGDTRQAEVDGAASACVRGILDSLVAGSDDRLRLLVSPDRIRGLKEGEEGVEILFDSTRTFASDALGTVSADRILVPFTGDHIGSEERPYVVIFTGEETYGAGPLQNPDGRRHALRLRDLVRSVVVDST